MLVHAKNPMGIAHIEQYRIYGRNWGYEPTDVPFSIYEKYKDVLVDATYREGSLSKIFGRPFPEIAFKYSELKHLPDITLDKLLTAFGVEFDADWQSKRKVENIKMILRHGLKTN